MPTITQALCYNCFQQVADPTQPCPHCGFDLRENQAKFPVALPAGTVLNDRYIVGRVLGQGGFGITYLAFDTQLQAKVAVKEYMPGEMATRTGTTVSVMMGTKSEDFTYGAERFQEEARTLAKFIGHPNIAGVSSYFDENGTSYFVMDYIEGVSFKNYIANSGGKVSVDETLNVMIPVLRALTAVHAEGFIHRDVTPDNIYISKDGNVKLLDFGSARYSIGDKSKSLDVILKVGYAPKEQYTRRGRQGPYTDVYSCAACFYAALTGYLPPESLERLDHDELVPVSQVLPDIPQWLDRAILKGLAVQPEDRFQSAAGFLDAIENQSLVEVPAYGKGGAAQPEAPASSRRQPLLIVAAGLAVAAAVGIGIFLGGGQMAADPGDPEAPPAQTAPEKEKVPTVTVFGRKIPIDRETLEITVADITQEDAQALSQLTGLRRLVLYISAPYETPDLSFLPALPWLEELEVDELYYPEDLEVLEALPHLRALTLQGSIGDVPVPDLSGMTELEELDIRDDAGRNNGRGAAWKLTFSDLAGLTKLRKLSFQSCNQTDLSGLAGLTNLEELSFNVARGADLTPLSGLARLRSLEMDWSNRDDNPLDPLDLSPLAKLTGLEKLSVSFINSDLAPLAGLTELRELSLFGIGSGVSPDLTPLTALTKLKTLEIGGMVPEEGVDLSPLAGMTSIQSARFYTIRAANWDAVDHIPNVAKEDIFD